MIERQKREHNSGAAEATQRVPFFTGRPLCLCARTQNISRYYSDCLLQPDVNFCTTVVYYDIGMDGNKANSVLIQFH